MIFLWNLMSLPEPYSKYGDIRSHVESQLYFACCWSGTQSATHATRCATHATHCKTLQHTARYCNCGETVCGGSTRSATGATRHDGAQYTVTHCDICNTLQHIAAHGNTLYLRIRRNAEAAREVRHTTSTATHCNTLQHTVTDYNILQHTAARCNKLQHTYIATR